ncbi:uncharacterized protein LOC130989503 [Salvia miltiorrhiza]|uniref:uncharacterized protein LOC130989503 n=1 Tax=Salvia miltiorrhiza TaxID=226208 RepID=UPI0025AD76D4|nr:uncharacterized protein LOC130989503 [Salvia miltiorrhiza]
MRPLFCTLPTIFDSFTHASYQPPHSISCQPNQLQKSRFSHAWQPPTPLISALKYLCIIEGNPSFALSLATQISFKLLSRSSLSMEFQVYNKRPPFKELFPYTDITRLCDQGDYRCFPKTGFYVYDLQALPIQVGWPVLTGLS